MSRARELGARNTPRARPPTTTVAARRATRRTSTKTSASLPVEQLVCAFLVRLPHPAAEPAAAASSITFAETHLATVRAATPLRPAPPGSPQSNLPLPAPPPPDVRNSISPKVDESTPIVVDVTTASAMSPDADATPEPLLEALPAPDTSDSTLTQTGVVTSASVERSDWASEDTCPLHARQMPAWSDFARCRRAHGLLTQQHVHAPGDVAREHPHAHRARVPAHQAPARAALCQPPRRVQVDTVYSKHDCVNAPCVVLWLPVWLPLIFVAHASLYMYDHIEGMAARYDTGSPFLTVFRDSPLISLSLLTAVLNDNYRVEDGLRQISSHLFGPNVSPDMVNPRCVSLTARLDMLLPLPWTRNPRPTCSTTWQLSSGDWWVFISFVVLSDPSSSA
jgi:hypothetical protein